MALSYLIKRYGSLALGICRIEISDFKLEPAVRIE